MSYLGTLTVHIDRRRSIKLCWFHGGVLFTIFQSLSVGLFEIFPKWRSTGMDTVFLNFNVMCVQGWKVLPICSNIAMKKYSTTYSLEHHLCEKRARSSAQAFPWDRPCVCVWPWHTSTFLCTPIVDKFSTKQRWNMEQYCSAFVRLFENIWAKYFWVKMSHQKRREYLTFLHILNFLFYARK